MGRAGVGCWDFLLSRLNHGIIPDLNKCIFVGDAAGREGIPKVRPRDFSDTDLKFALNIGIGFKTPEEFFLNKKQRYAATFAFDPRDLGSTVDPIDLAPAFKIKETPASEVVILIGPPGSGKTTLARQYFVQYYHVNQDTLKTKASCLKAARGALLEGRSVIIDNQNRDTKTRKDYIDMCRKLSKELHRPIGIRAVYMDIPKALCWHLNAYRSLCLDSPEYRVEAVPPMAVHSFFKFREPPTVIEGFNSVTVWGLKNLQPGPFKSLEAGRLFRMFLV